MPKYMQIAPYDVENGTEVGTDTWIPFTVNDTHFQEFWYYWVDSENQTTEIYQTTVPGTLAPTTPGDWELHVYANDTAGNPTLYDSPSRGTPLNPGDYSITVTVVETVIYDDSIRIV